MSNLSDLSYSSTPLIGWYFSVPHRIIGASLMVQLVKNPPAMRETWVRSLGWEDPWRRERLPSPVFWLGEFHGL